MAITKDVKCPHCEVVQSDNIYNIVNTDTSEAGQLEHRCDSCKESFVVDFELTAKVYTYKS